MAEEVVALKVDIQGTERSINSLKDLKAARKDLQNAFLQGDEQAIKSLKKLDDAMGDLQDATKSVQGDGVEPLRNSFRLFTEGLTNFDFGKIGTAFKGLGAAIKAVPIFLLVEGITYLITNFKELSEGTGIVAKALKPIGDLFTWITDKIYALTDAIGLTNSELDKMGEAVKTNADKAKEALSQQTAEYDRQIAVAKAAGKSTVELEQAKQQAIIDTNVAIVKQIEAFVRAGGVLDEEKQKLLTASLEAIKNAKVQEYVIEETAEKAKADLAKKASDERKKLMEEETAKRLEEIEKQRKYEEEQNRIRAEESKRITKEITDFQSNFLKQQKEESDNKYLEDQAKEERKAKQKEEDAKKEIELERVKEQQKAEITTKSVQAAQALTNLYFEGQLRAAKGNADKEREIKKKQFNINKAFGITNAVIDGVRSVQAALTQTPPLSYVLAALNAALAIANVTQIASAKFDDSGGGSGASGANAIQGSVGGASAPTIASPNNTVTQIDDKGMINKAKEEEKPQKVYVTESDITEKQKRVSLMENAATL